MTSTLSPAAVTTGLAEVLEEVAGTPAEAVVATAKFDADLDVDSLTMVEVVVACEEKFGIRIPDEALESMTTVGDAVAFILSAASTGGTA
ncbi:MAG: acyl carrier protein [Frankiales bacterium]|nr:acyl carrier protein [Frankiales bacterium]